MPFNFSWLMPGQVAGMARPRSDDVRWLRDQGVTAVVSLTEREPAGLDELAVLHEPVRDMTPPTLDQIHRVIGFIEQELAREGAVVVHCTAGMGRTGTLLAAWLVSRGQPAGEAIEFVRLTRPGSIETRGQEDVIRQFAELMGVDPK
ncbi:MAG: phosphatase domain-containing putative toxin [Planctomycetota bacterium]|jgi:atypical dual specificity phosphatase